MCVMYIYACICVWCVCALSVCMCIYIYMYVFVYMRCARVFGCVGYIFVCIVYACMCSLLGRLTGNILQLIFLRDFAEGAISWLLGNRLGICHQIQAFQGFYCNFLNSQVFSRLLRPFAHSLSSDKI